MLVDIEEAIRCARESAYAASTSDLHVEGNEPPWQRVDGAMQRTELPVVEPESVRVFCETYLSKKEYERLNGQHGAADGAIQHPSFGAVRIHAFRGEKGLALSLRLLREGVPELSTLGLPDIISGFADFPTGLVLFTGPTGSGKSTTIASLLDRLNATAAKHIMTFEDPVEYVHVWLKSVVTQYEIGRDVASFADGVRGALRADPDVLFIGELRGLETVSAALQAAETGHLVFAALHTPSETPQAINRIIGLFPSEEQERARTRFADCLRALVGLRLLPLRDGIGLRAAAEILIATEAVRRIIRDGATHQLRATIATSRKDGSQTLESHLSELVSGGHVDLGLARAASLYPDEVRELPAGSLRRR
jgi:twitching motility protein PilT